MGSFILRVIVNAAAIWVASWVLPGLEISSAEASEAVSRTGVTEGADTIGTVLAYLFIGAIFGVVNAFVRPLVRFLALPITILTLGLFAIVINAAMLYLTSWISSYTPVEFSIDSFFWTAVLAAIIISVFPLWRESCPVAAGGSPRPHSVPPTGGQEHVAGSAGQAA